MYDKTMEIIWKVQYLPKRHFIIRKYRKIKRRKNKKKKTVKDKGERNPQS